MSFYHIRSREGAKYEAVIHCSLTGSQQGEYRRMKEQLWLNWTNRGMNQILTCLGLLDWLFWRRRTFVAWNRLNWTKKKTTEQTEIGQLNDEDIDNFITENRNKIEANWIFFFCSGIIKLLFDGLAYITSGHFAHCSQIVRNSQNSRTYYMLSHRIRCISLTLKPSFVHYED